MGIFSPEPREVPKPENFAKPRVKNIGGFAEKVFES